MGYVFLWIFIVVVHAISIMPYRELSALEKIQKGYLLWSENFAWQRNKLRVDIQLRGFVRYQFHGSPNRNKLRDKVNQSLRNLEQFDPHKYYLDKKQGRIRI